MTAALLAKVASSQTILVVATVAASVVAAAALWYTRQQSRLGKRDDARDEAMQLAEVRASTILALREDIDQLRKDQDEERETCARNIEDLRQTIARVGTEAADSQRLLLSGLRQVLTSTLGYLEAVPPDVDRAVDFLRETLTDPAKPAPPPRR